MQMVLVLQECGMRISELLQLPLDCLTQDTRGTFYLQYLQDKMKREHMIPVSQEIARVVQEQQQVVRAADNETSFLFPSSKGGVMKQQSFAQRLNRLAYDHQIRDANGKLFRFQSHQFRHTVGTRMINLGVPHHFIQRYLGHLGPEMTSRYAHIHDATMREKLSEYLQGTLVDVTGKVVPEEGPLDTGDCAGSRATCSLKPCQTAIARFRSLPGQVLIRMRVCIALTSAPTPASSMCTRRSSATQSKSSLRPTRMGGLDRSK
jgi:integrase-like protein